MAFGTESTAAGGAGYGQTSLTGHTSVLDLSICGRVLSGSWGSLRKVQTGLIAPCLVCQRAVEKGSDRCPLSNLFRMQPHVE
ncbi:hypothetical protein SRHO_G00317230 [Serrasalmus rhombeus]